MRRVLIVDDSPALRKSLEGILEPWGLDIDHAENGAVGLAKLQRQPYDLVFLDLNMPVLDGPSLLRIARARGIETPVVLITSGASTPIAASAIRLGAAEFLSKPFTADDVQRAVVKAAGIATSSLHMERPGVLIQHADQNVALSLRQLLPAHVDSDFVVTLKLCLDAAERRQYQLVLVDSTVLEGEVSAAATMIRERQREAGILALAPRAAPEDRYRSEGALDGAIPRELDEELVHDFLYNQYLRPLVFNDGVSLFAAAFRGTPPDLGTYFGRLARVLASRALSQAEAAGEITVDLTRAPDDFDRLTKVARYVCDQLAQSGIAVAFRVTDKAKAAMAARPELARVVLLGEGS